MILMGIYKITSPSGKIYIGQSIDIYSRWKGYEKLRCKNQTKLYNSLVKYGWDQHDKEIIEECLEEILVERETYWKLFYKVLEIPSLCCRIDGKGGRMSQETKDKIREHRLNNPFSPEAISNIKKAHKGMKYSDESKKLISLSKINHPMYTEEWKNKISDSLQNMSYDDKLKRSKLISDKTKGNSKPTNFGDKISKIHKGRKNSEETKKKMSESGKGRGAKPVIQCDLEGNFIREWSSAQEAELHFNVKGLGKDNIGCVCRGKRKKTYGFKWKFK